MTKYEKVSIFFSICALLISSLGYYNSNTQYQERKEFDKKLRQSQVTIQMGKNREQKNILFKKINFFKKYSAIYEQEYTLILNNIGFESATITFWKVDKLSYETYNGKKTQMYGSFLGMNPKILDMQNNEVIFPVVLEPKKALRLKLKIGILVPTIAWNALKNQIKYDTEYSYTDITQKFSDKGYPEFGQYSLAKTKIGDPFIVNSYGENEFLSKFLLTLTKENGQTIQAKFFPSASEYTIQGNNIGTADDGFTY